MIVCPACNAENLSGEAVCHHCGEHLPPPATVACVVCAAPVNAGVKFCKRCGAAQPEAGQGKAAAPRPAAPRHVHTDTDDGGKTVILPPEAREAVMAELRKSAPAAESSSASKAPRKTAARTSSSRPDRAISQKHAPKRNYLAIGLGVGAFLVAALVSTLLLTSGHAPEQASEMPLDAASAIPTGEPTTTSAPITAAPVETSSAPVQVAPPPPAPDLTPTTRPAMPAVSEPVATPTTPPAAAEADATAPKKPKHNPKADAAAAKRKQAEESLKRLLNP